MYIFIVTTLRMQNSTPPVKGKTCCSINQQIKVLCKQFVFSVTYMIAVPRPHYLPIYVRECRPPSGKRIECTANCALLSHCTAYCCRSSTHSEYSNNTFTVTTGDDISQRPTCDPQHSTQFPILNAEPEYVCTETDSLLQRARYNI